MNEVKVEREIREDDFVQVKYPLIKRLHELGIKNGNEIMLFCKIFYLQCDGKECIASNDYFAKLFCLSDRQIRDYLSDLKVKGLIKTYEKKLGMKTTTRYIYVQHDVLGTEDIFQSSNKAAEETRKTSGKKTSKERKKSVKAEEDNFHHIKEDKRIEENNIYNGTKVPMVADAPTEESLLSSPASDEAQQTETEINFNSKTGLLNSRIKFVMDKVIEEINVNGHSYESMIDYLLKEFTGHHYQCDKQAIIEYANRKLLKQSA